MTIFIKNLSASGLIADFYPVKYVDKFPTINGFDTPNPDNLITVLSTKEVSWEYEKEIRLILISGTNYSVIIDDTVINEIIFGMKILDKSKFIESNFAIGR